jgi:hypothetical protein
VSTAAASEVIDHARQMALPEAACALLQPRMHQAEAVETLRVNGHAQASLSLGLRALPRPYAVAWLCQQARECTLVPAEHAGLQLAQAWVQSPDETRRLRALEFSDQADPDTAALALAGAAGWADGTLGEDPGTPVPLHLTAVMATAALIQLAARTPQTFDERLQTWAQRISVLLAGMGASAATTSRFDEEAHG